MADTHDEYALGRDKEETDRLNAQHGTLLKVTKNLIEESIAKQVIHERGNIAIADIGTGTGAWLIDALREWGKNNYYHGFDISHEQFPQGVENISFSTHDITVPFPKEHLNRYDIVHVRLLIAALNESKYRKAVANVYALLKPGGWIQWEEVDEKSYQSSTNPVIWEIERFFRHSYKAEGKCFKASEKIHDECARRGFLGVRQIVYTSERDIREETEERLAELIGTLYARFLLRSKRFNEKEASERANELIRLHRKVCADGDSPPLILTRVIGQKGFSPELRSLNTTIYLNSHACKL